MKKRILAAAVVVAFIFSIIGQAGSLGKTAYTNIINTKQLTQEEKLDDFEYMYTILKENYPYFEVNKRLNGIDWLSKKNEYISKIKSTDNDDSFFNTLQNILSGLNNGHTDMLDRNFYYYAKSIYEKDSKSNEEWIKQLNDSKAVNRYSNLQSVGQVSQLSSNDVIYDNVKTNILEKAKVAYLSIHSFNTFNIQGDMKVIKPYLQSIKNYKTLIIDIRGNGGGDSSYWADNIVPMLINKPLDDTQYLAFRGGSFVEQFIKCRFGFGYKKLEPISNIYKENLKNLPPEVKEEFKYYSQNKIHYEPKNSIGFSGRIYLLVDGNVFSSAEAFAAFAKSTGFATLVGERTGGDGIGFDPAVCVLPNSGYVFRFTLEMGLTSDGSCNFEHRTEPDIKVSSKVSSNPSKDEAIQTVLKYNRR